MVERYYVQDVQLLAHKPDGTIARVSFWTAVLSLKNKILLPHLFTSDYKGVFILSYVLPEGGHKLLKIMQTTNALDAIPKFIEGVEDIEYCYLSYCNESSELIRKTIVEEIASEFNVPSFVL